MKLSAEEVNFDAPNVNLTLENGTHISCQMENDRGDSFPFDFKLIRIIYDSMIERRVILS